MHDLGGARGGAARQRGARRRAVERAPQAAQREADARRARRLPLDVELAAQAVQRRLKPGPALSARPTAAEQPRPASRRSPESATPPSAAPSAAVASRTSSPRGASGRPAAGSVDRRRYGRRSAGRSRPRGDRRGTPAASRSANAAAGAPRSRIALEPPIDPGRAASGGGDAGQHAKARDARRFRGAAVVDPLAAPAPASGDVLIEIEQPGHGELQRQRHRGSVREQRADQGRRRDWRRRAGTSAPPGCCASAGRRRAPSASARSYSAAQPVERLAAVDARRRVGRRPRASQESSRLRPVARSLADQPQQECVFEAMGAARGVFALILAQLAPLGEPARRRQQRLGDRFGRRGDVAAPPRRAVESGPEPRIDRQPRRTRPIPPPAPAATRESGEVAARQAAPRRRPTPRRRARRSRRRRASPPRPRAGAGGSSSRQSSRARPGPR